MSRFGASRNTSTRPAPFHPVADAESGTHLHHVADVLPTTCQGRQLDACPTETTTPGLARGTLVALLVAVERQ